MTSRNKQIRQIPRGGHDERRLDVIHETVRNGLSKAPERLRKQISQDEIDKRLSKMGLK